MKTSRVRAYDEVTVAKRTPDVPDNDFRCEICGECAARAMLRPFLQKFDSIFIFSYRFGTHEGQVLSTFTMGHHGSPVWVPATRHFELLGQPWAGPTTHKQLFCANFRSARSGPVYCTPNYEQRLTLISSPLFEWTGRFDD